MTPYYSDDLVAIYHGDCRDILPDIEADIVVSDPPYGIALRNNGRRDGHRANRDWTIAGDTDTEVGQWMVDWCAQWAKPTVVFASPMKPWHGEWRQFLVWDKGEHVAGGGDVLTTWKPTWELIQVARTKELRDRRDSAVLRFPAVTADYDLHPSPKPLSLMRYLVRKVATGRILDPFMGAGSTLVAAKSLGQKAIGIEVEERYCERAALRCSQETLGLVG